MKKDNSNKKNVLQKCLPGVTLRTSLSDSATEYKGYHSLDVVGSTTSLEGESSPTTQAIWLEERARRQRHHTTRGYIRVTAVLFLLIVLAKWREEATSSNYNNNNYRPQPSTSTTEQTPQQQPEERRHGDHAHGWMRGSTSSSSNDGGNSDDDNNRDEILHILKNLDEEIEGDIVLQSSKPKFKEASQVWRQGLLPPLAVIEAKTQEDVEKILPILTGLARDYKLDFRVRSGGHNHAGYSTVKDGVVLSLSNLNATTVQKATNSSTISTVIVEPGVRVEQFLQASLDQSGMAGVVADAAGVGMIGFVLGGGYGFQSRKYGLGIDNVVRLRVVLTNGIVQDVGPGDDLFWALRGGGGGNFGVVTEMEYQVYDMDDMKLAGSVNMPLLELPGFLQKLGQKEADLDGNFVAMVRNYEQQHSQDHYKYGVSSTASALWRTGINSNGAGAKEDGTVTVSFFWAGDANPDDPVGEEYIKKEVVPLLPKEASEVAYYYFSWSAKTREKEQDSTWSSVYAAQSWNGFLFAENNSDAVWQDIRENLSVLFRYCTFLKPKIELWGGAIASNDAFGNATAFPHRDALYSVGVELLVPDGTENAEQIFQQQSALIGAVWPSIATYLQGSYVNYPMPSLTKDEYPTAYWGDNLGRLMSLKQQYDPFHVLKFEQSIPVQENPSNNTIGGLR